MANGALIDRVVCLSELSKDLEGELRLLESEKERCKELDCTTLETVHQLELKVARHDCDSDVGSLLDGTLHSGDLVHKFKDGDGNRRGVHEGTFRWRGRGTLATGTLTGITNAGTHRKPAFDDCQRCDERGVMEGMLIGVIRRARDRRLIGCEVRAAYRLRFDPSEQGGSGAISGTLEGALVCDCPGRPERICVELSAVAPGPHNNPLEEQGVFFTVFDGAGTQPTNSQIRSMGAFTGLDVGFRTEIKLPVVCSSVEATLVTLAQPDQLEAFNTDGSSAGVATMTGTQNVAETLTVTGSAIERAVITARQNESLLLRLCYVPLAG
jgi:hypothetical protein